MITREQLASGIIRYIDTEIIPALPTASKWGVGTLVILAKGKYEDLIANAINMPIVKALGVVDENGLIDIDALANALRQSAGKYGNLQIEIPFGGTLSFTAEDVDRLKMRITGG